MMLSSSDRSPGSAHAASDYLIKPVGFTELQAAIYRQLADPESRQAAVVTSPAISQAELSSEY